MDSGFEKYMFQEILQRPDRGAGWFPRFTLEITGQKLLDLAITPIKEAPLLNDLPVSSATSVACLLKAADIAPDGSVTNKNYAIKKDMCAIFATVGYLATAFGRDTHIHAETKSPRKSGQLYFSPAKFQGASTALKDNTIGFFFGATYEVFKDKSFKRATKSKASVRISMIPGQTLS